MLCYDASFKRQMFLFHSPQWEMIHTDALSAKRPHKDSLNNLSFIVKHTLWNEVKEELALLGVRRYFKAKYKDVY